MIRTLRYRLLLAFLAVRRFRRRTFRLAPARLWLFAVLIAAAAAFAVIGFRIAIDAVSVIAFGGTEEMVASAAASLNFFRAWAAPIIGGLAVSGLMYLTGRYNWLPEGRTQGVAEVIEARAIRDGRVSFRAGLSSAAISAVSLGSGASAGREGPAVHIGATIASILDRWFGFSAKDRRTLLGCGAAAAVSASFNAPVAGVIFALEVILGNYALSVFGPIAAASVTAAIVTKLTLGDFPAFAAPAYGAATALDVPLSALLGVICGLVATVFLLCTEQLTERVRNFASERNISYIFLPPIAGLLVGLIGAWHPEIFGVGYEAVTRALQGEYSLRILFTLAVLKITATAITVSCRFGGGVFSPGLVIGVFAGAAFGAAVSEALPDHAAGATYYAMVGMGAASGAIIGAPISTTLIVFELTGDYTMTMSLMVAVALATLITQSLAGKSFFHWQLSRRGYDLSEGPQGVILKTIRVRDVMDRMPQNAPLDKDAARLEAQQSLGEAIALLERESEDGLPVVDPGSPEKVIGYLSRVKALAAYNRALIDSHIEHHI
ncbi:MAG: chloride channel protein [Pseudomonadota bacterium]